MALIVSQVLQRENKSLKELVMNQQDRIEELKALREDALTENDKMRRKLKLMDGRVADVASHDIETLELL